VLGYSGAECGVLKDRGAGCPRGWAVGCWVLGSQGGAGLWGAGGAGWGVPRAGPWVRGLTGLFQLEETLQLRAESRQGSLRGDSLRGDSLRGDSLRGTSICSAMVRAGGAPGGGGPLSAPTRTRPRAAAAGAWPPPPARSRAVQPPAMGAKPPPGGATPPLGVQTPPCLHTPLHACAPPPSTQPRGGPGASVRQR